MQKFKNFIHLIEAILANVIYGFPARSMTVIGVTGTDGKTTTTHLIYHILHSAGKKVSFISTIEANILGNKYDTGFHVTTPSPFALQKLIRKAQLKGTEYLVLEVTSHALDQYRNFGIPISIAVITNISHEHLDYHKNMEEYKKAKAKILKYAKFAVLNKDDSNFHYFSKINRGRTISFSLKDRSAHQSFISINNPNLLGNYNRYNVLAAANVSQILGIKEPAIKRAIRTFKGIPGRLEKIKNSKGLNIFIDFAHKINALDNVLQTLKKTGKSRLIAVFGSAGLRDKSKRPVMGEVAAKSADIIVITAEDPRTEDVRDIIDSIAQGCLKMGMKEADKNNSLDKINKKSKFFFKIPDRQEAINFAIRKIAKRSDTLVFCGKGHEKSMCYGNVEYPWNEKAAINKALYG